jgi:hypothetical protein
MRRPSMKIATSGADSIDRRVTSGVSVERRGCGVTCTVGIAREHRPAPAP